MITPKGNLTTQLREIQEELRRQRPVRTYGILTSRRTRGGSRRPTNTDTDSTITTANPKWG